MVINESTPVWSGWDEWTIIEELGRGSYGIVYKAVRRDYDLVSYAAVKIITIPSNHSEIESLRAEGYDENSTRSYLENIVKDFTKEIKIMQGFEGLQNLVSISDYRVIASEQELSWKIYIRMELLKPLNHYYKNRQITEPEVIRLGSDICKALEICSRLNIIHRDIKPENIFVNHLGNYKLGDFGIARSLSNLTGSLSTKGTFNYMAPEVYHGEHYDMTADLYSLGITLYRFLNRNRMPFIPLDTAPSYEERNAALRIRMSGAPLPAPVDASPAMASVILKACAYRKELRFRSASEMLYYLNLAYEHPEAPLFSEPGTAAQSGYNGNNTISVSKPPASRSEPEHPPKKNRILIPILCAAMLALAGGVGLGIYSHFFAGSTETSETESPTEIMTEATTEIMTEATTEAILVADSESASEDITATHRISVVPGAVSAAFNESDVIPVGPGSSITKSRFSTGAVGSNTGIAEYKVNMEVSKRVRDLLEERGYEVYLSRDDSSILKDAIECSEETYNFGSEICIQIYCRKNQTIAANGAMVYTCSANNPYVAAMYDVCDRLANALLTSYCESTPFANSGIQYKDDTAGINWSKVPSVQMQLGCMTDAGDEALLADSANWDDMAEGIVNGIDAFFAE